MSFWSMPSTAAAAAGSPRCVHPRDTDHPSCMPYARCMAGAACRLWKSGSRASQSVNDVASPLRAARSAFGSGGGGGASGALPSRGPESRVLRGGHSLFSPGRSASRMVRYTCELPGRTSRTNARTGAPAESAFGSATEHDATTRSPSGKRQRLGATPSKSYATTASISISTCFAALLMTWPHTIDPGVRWAYAPCSGAPGSARRSAPL
mmetsp:Transcript_5249/g.21198  ORF Transcript_5249/g.21198 Transcript_5249/m.21198 type:complete len:209 (+) Transcript_5249:1428-2054(+)